MFSCQEKLSDLGGEALICDVVAENKIRAGIVQKSVEKERKSLIIQVYIFEEESIK
jgi:hypothetical protein